MPATSTVSVASDPMVNGVLSGIKWAQSRFTYSFPANASYYGSGYGSGEPSQGFEAMNSAQQKAVRDVLGQFSAVANVTFTEITETSTQHADLRFAESDVPGTAWAYLPTTRGEGGDSWFNNSRNYYDAPVKGNYAYTALIHEIGHALGLKHPHETVGSFPAMPSGYDSMNYTVMSYNSYAGAAGGGYTNETWGYAQSLMMADIAALQHMYGANFNTNSGNTVYSWSPTTGEMFVNGSGQGAPGGNRIFVTVWDGGGVDTYDFSNYTTNLTVSLAPGAWSTVSSAQLAKLHYSGSEVAAGNIANALQYDGDPRSLIENAKGGSGHDSLSGNTAANSLSGGSGNDKLAGLGGSDKLTGGSGNDKLTGGAGKDTAVFSGKASSYSWNKNSDGSWTVTDKSAAAADGTDTLVSVEVLQFSDTTVALGTTRGSSGRWASRARDDANGDFLALAAEADSFVFAGGDWSGSAAPPAADLGDASQAWDALAGDWDAWLPNAVAADQAGQAAAPGYGAGDDWLC